MKTLATKEKTDSCEPVSKNEAGCGTRHEPIKEEIQRFLYLCLYETSS
jgi:hypothetical protein